MIRVLWRPTTVIGLGILMVTFYLWNIFFAELSNDVVLDERENLMMDDQILETTPIEIDECHPQHDVMFLKTHKCGSSTIQRIFLRYGKYHGLSFILPDGGNYMGGKASFSHRMIPKSLQTPDNHYNMMVIHTRFQEDALSKVMNDGAKWVTILRDPYEQFESLWSYYRLEKFYNMPMSQFVKLSYSDASKQRKDGMYGIHQMMFDLGYGKIGYLEENEIYLLLSRLKKAFDLVMIAEKFDESLILLKNMMCWTTADITYLTINSRQNEYKYNLSEITRNDLYVLNKPDFMLYKFFLEIFNEKVEKFGREKMQSEIKALREANKQLEKECQIEEIPPTQVAEDSGWDEKIKNMAVKSNSIKCQDLVKSELLFVDEVRDKQRAWVQSNWMQNLSIF